MEKGQIHTRKPQVSRDSDGWGLYTSGHSTAKVSLDLCVDGLHSVQVDSVDWVVLSAPWLPACYRWHVGHLTLGMLVVI